jgi:hypothetical protein
MNWLHWLKELGISPSSDASKREHRTPIRRTYASSPDRTPIKNTIRVLFEQALLHPGGSTDFRWDENDSQSVWVWNPREVNTEEEIDALFDEWALHIRAMGYVEQLNDQQELSDGGEQMTRFRRYLKPSLYASLRGSMSASLGDSMSVSKRDSLGDSMSVSKRDSLGDSMSDSNRPKGQHTLNFGNIMLEIQKNHGITQQFRVQLTRYPGRNTEKTASMAAFMERMLAQ